jgi:CelD/BcsL family acetyltransferase involved in cellulose biosynthesis
VTTSTAAVAASPTVHADLAAVSNLEAEWRQLATDVTGTSYFTSPDWVLSWAESVGAGARPQVAVWRDTNGHLDAVVPLGLIRHKLHPRAPFAVRAGTNLGSGPGAADHCGWAVRAGRAAEVRDWIAATSRRTSLVLNNLDPDTGVPFVPAGAVLVGSSPCPRVDIPADPNEIGASSKFRKQLRAYGRKVERLGIEFRWVPPGELTPALLHVVFDLHAQRQAAAGWSTMFDRSKAGLHQRLIARAGPGRGPALVLAERDGDPVAALYGFRWGDVFAYYQTGWRPELAEANLATVLVAQAMRFARADGAMVFDFLRGAESYKYRFGATDRVDETWLVPAGLGGRVLRGKFALRERARGDAS